MNPKNKRRWLYAIAGGIVFQVVPIFLMFYYHNAPQTRWTNFLDRIAPLLYPGALVLPAPEAEMPPNPLTPWFRGAIALTVNIIVHSVLIYVLLLVVNKVTSLRSSSADAA